MRQEYKKQLIKVLIGAGVLLLIILIGKPQPTEKKTLDNGCPVFYTTSQHGDINLPVGTIFGYPAKSGENLYDIIRDDTFIMSAYFIESFEKNFKCFKTEEEAVAAGYTKFLSDQAARKKRQLEAQEWLNKSPEERVKDCENQGFNEEECSAKLLWSIDSVIGL